MAVEKTIEIAGQKVQFKGDGGIPLRYRALFRRDYIADILSVSAVMTVLDDINGTSISALANLNTEVLYNITYLLAKNADGSIPEPLEWFASFDEFPLLDVFKELEDLLMSNMQTRVKKVKKK